MTIVPMTCAHREAVLSMMRTFYTSPAVWTNGSEEIYRTDIDTCISNSPYLEGYVFLEGEEILGYAMAAKSFSTEFGKPCIWIEDLYMIPSARGQGIGSDFLTYIHSKYPDAILRLEVEEENTVALHVYEKNGFTRLPYAEMKKEASSI